MPDYSTEHSICRPYHLQHKGLGSGEGLDCQSCGSLLVWLGDTV